MVPDSESGLTPKPPKQPHTYRDMHGELVKHKSKMLGLGGSLPGFSSKYQKEVENDYHAAMAAIVFQYDTTVQKNGDTYEPLGAEGDKKLNDYAEDDIERWSRFADNATMLGKEASSRYGLESPVSSWWNPWRDSVKYDAYNLPDPEKGGVYAIKSGNMITGRNNSNYAQLYRIALEDKGIDHKLTIRFTQSKAEAVKHMLVMAARNAARPPDIVDRARQITPMPDGSKNQHQVITETSPGDFEYKELVSHNENLTTDVIAAQDTVHGFHRIVCAAYYLRQAGLNNKEVQGALLDSLANKATSEDVSVEAKKDENVETKKSEESSWGKLEKVEGINETKVQQAKEVLGEVEAKQLKEYTKLAKLNHLDRYVFERKVNPPAMDDKKTAVYIGKEKGENFTASRDLATDIGEYNGVLVSDEAVLKDKAAIKTLEEGKQALEAEIKGYKEELKDVERQIKVNETSLLDHKCAALKTIASLDKDNMEKIDKYIKKLNRPNFGIEKLNSLQDHEKDWINELYEKNKSNVKNDNLKRRIGGYEKNIETYKEGGELYTGKKFIGTTTGQYTLGLLIESREALKGVIDTHLKALAVPGYVSGYTDTPKLGKLLAEKKYEGFKGGMDGRADAMRYASMLNLGLVDAIETKERLVEDPGNFNEARTSCIKEYEKKYNDIVEKTKPLIAKPEISGEGVTAKASKGLVGGVGS